MIRLLFCDVDGTLLDAGQTELAPARLEALRALLDVGMQVAIISGRPLYNLQHLFAPLADRLYFIAHDGAVCARGDRLLFVRPLPAADLQQALAFRPLREADLFAATATATYVLRANEDLIRAMAASRADRLFGADSLRKIPDPVCKLSFHINGVRPEQPPCSGLRRCLGHSDWCELVARYVTKGSAAASLQEHLFCSVTETAAIGNDENDRPLLARAALAAVPAGSPLAAARPNTAAGTPARVTPTVDAFLQGLL